MWIFETWLNDKLHNNLVSINGFNIVRLDRVTDKRGGGLLFHINNNVTYEATEIANGNGIFSDANIEMLSVIIKPINQRI